MRNIISELSIKPHLIWKTEGYLLLPPIRKKRKKKQDLQRRKKERGKKKMKKKRNQGLMVHGTLISMKSK